MGTLLPAVDKKATIIKVRRFFEHDDQYPLIKRRAWFSGIKSPQMDVTGIHGSRKANSSESMMINYAEYAQAKRAVEHAIKGCSNTAKFPSQDILKYRYIQQLTVSQVKEILNRKYGHSTYQRADDQACYEFAECLDGVATAMSVNRKIVPVMITFLKNGKQSGQNRETNGKQVGNKL